MLKASDLRAAHGDTTIFEGLSLTLSGDRRVGLVGPNGAGKTTLLRLLAGVTAPERGSVALGPGDRIGYLPQEPPGPELTIDRLLGAALGEVWELHAELERLEPRLARSGRAGRATARRRSASARSAAGRCSAARRRARRARHRARPARRAARRAQRRRGGPRAAGRRAARAADGAAARRADQPPRPRRPRRGWRTSSPGSPARCWSSRTTAGSSTRRCRRSSSSTAAS